MLKTTKFSLFCLLAIPAISWAQQRAASGPVEAINISGRTITVVGQTFALTSATKFAEHGKQLSADAGLQSIGLQDSVSITGFDGVDGSIATAIELDRNSYVAGASPVYVLGPVSKVSRDSAQIRVGSLVIDASTVPSELFAKVSSGTLIEVSGSQPNSKGTLVGPLLFSIGATNSKKQSIGGTGKLEVRGEEKPGTQVQSIGGTGRALQAKIAVALQKQSIGGTGIQRQSIGGTGLQKTSIGGTGVQAQSIGGTGRQVQSIGGTGRQLQSIGGTGVQAQSIGGTGRQLQSIGGTGTQLQSIGGTGRQLQSIGGTGVQAQSIGGTGRQLQSIGGTGRQIQSIGGTGIQLQSIGGTGKQLQSIGGTGVHSSR